MANDIVKHDYNGTPIRQKLSDDYVCLTDMAKAGNWSLPEFLKTHRYHETIACLYQLQEGLIKHLVEVDSNGDIWADLQVGISFSYFVHLCDAPGMQFYIWFSRAFSPFLKASREGTLQSGMATARATLDEMPSRKIEIAAKSKTGEKKEVGHRRVYFILNKTKKQVKIGYSLCPEARLKAFQCGTTDELSIILTFSGGLKEEREVHKLLSKHRIGKTEIFRYNDELKNAIAEFMDAKVLSTAV